MLNSSEKSCGSCCYDCVLVGIHYSLPWYENKGNMHNNAMYIANFNAYAYAWQKAGKQSVVGRYQIITRRRCARQYVTSIIYGKLYDI